MLCESSQFVNVGNLFKYFNITPPPTKANILFLQMLSECQIEAELESSAFFNEDFLLDVILWNNFL